MSTAEKIRAAEAAARWRQRHPGPVVFTNGVFDLLHVGHVALLEAARAEGAAPPGEEAAGGGEAHLLLDEVGGGLVVVEVVQQFGQVQGEIAVERAGGAPLQNFA